MKSIIVIILVILNIGYFIWALVSSDHYELPARIMEGVPAVILIPTQNIYAYESKNSKLQSSCYSLGPFKSILTAKRVVNNIENIGLATKIKTQKTKKTLNYLVYLAPLSSREKALVVVKDVKKHKVKNTKIIENGRYKNAVSLGFFGSLDKAQRHVEYIKFLGYDAKYMERKQEVYWINYDEPFGSNAPVLKWVDKANAKIKVQKIPRSCLL